MARMGYWSRDPEFWSGDQRIVRSLAEAVQVVWPIAVIFLSFLTLHIHTKGLQDVKQPLNVF